MVKAVVTKAEQSTEACFRRDTGGKAEVGVGVGVESGSGMTSRVAIRAVSWGLELCVGIAFQIGEQEKGGEGKRKDHTW